MNTIGKYEIDNQELRLDFGTSTGWVFLLDNEGKLDFNKFGIDLRWRIGVMTQDINNHHKTNFTHRQIQRMLEKMVETSGMESGQISVDQDGVTYSH